MCACVRACVNLLGLCTVSFLYANFQAHDRLQGSTHQIPALLELHAVVCVLLHMCSVFKVKLKNLFKEYVFLSLRK